MALRRNVSISDYFGFCCLVDVWLMCGLLLPYKDLAAVMGK